MKKQDQKQELHPNNKHRNRYDFPGLIQSSPALKPYVRPNEHGDLSINFFDPNAVRALNKALLIHFYGVRYWDIPGHYLCPPIPSRADYIHHVAELLGREGTTPQNLSCLDVGVGANCVYPIIGNHAYNWKFVGSDIDPKSLEIAQHIIHQNPSLKNQVTLRFQKNSGHIFQGIIEPEDRFDLSICNPPFHASAREARAAAHRKLSNLKGNLRGKTVLNFGGKGGELWCKGGELEFIQQMILESRRYSSQCRWFTTLVSKSKHLKRIHQHLRNQEAQQVETLEMGQGNKMSRIVAWRF